MQAADQADRDFAGLLLGVHAIVERAWILRDVVDFERRVLEDEVLHLGLLGNRLELIREKNQVAARRRRGGWLLLRRLLSRGRRGGCTAREEYCRNQQNT